MGIIEGGKNQPPPPPKKAFQQNPKKYLDQKLTPKTPLPNFQALKFSRKG